MSGMKNDYYLGNIEKRRKRFSFFKKLLDQIVEKNKCKVDVNLFIDAYRRLDKQAQQNKAALRELYQRLTVESYLLTDDDIDLLREERLFVKSPREYKYFGDESFIAVNERIFYEKDWELFLRAY